jgi:hypothetical protein
MAIAGRTGWVWVRRAVQLVPLVAILFAPFLGGWQRLDRANMAVWDGSGFDLSDSTREELPLGERPQQAYDSLYLIGGGVGADYFGIPAVDPVAGVVAAVFGGLSLMFAVALLLPLALAFLFGRAFCGWMCPFGTISRGLSYVLRRLPWRPPVYAVPKRRIVRWVVMVATIGLSVAGVHVVLFVFLPHLLMQQSVYAMWLLGGGGAALGIFIGLVAAGLVFGPTLYCATVCPTGAALSLPGRARLVKVTLAEPTECGKHCALCDAACWLQLEPSSGNPGADCDLCARCFTVCPKTNLRVTAGKPKRRHLPVISALLVAGLTVLGARPAAAEVMGKPELVLNGEVVRDGVTLAASVVDMSQVKLDADWEMKQRGVELSIYIARGTTEQKDPRASVPFRDVYTGPLNVEIVTGGRRIPVSFDEPTNPISTPNRVIYRRTLGLTLGAGDQIIIAPVDGWTTSATSWRVPARGVAPAWHTTVFAAFASALAFMGLLLIALSGKPTDRARPKRRPKSDAQELQRT